MARTLILADLMFTLFHTSKGKLVVRLENTGNVLDLEDFTKRVERLLQELKLHQEVKDETAS